MQWILKIKRYIHIHHDLQLVQYLHLQALTVPFEKTFVMVMETFSRAGGLMLVGTELFTLVEKKVPKNGLNKTFITNQ